MSSANNYPNYEKLRQDLLAVLEKYKKGDLKLEDIRREASDLDDEHFPDENPEFYKGNLYSLYSHVLFQLEFFSRIFPEDIPIIEKTLNCTQENLEECVKNWEYYWFDKDPTKRHLEGIKRGYWKE